MKTIITVFSTFLLFSTVSLATSFLDGLGGDYSLSGDECQFSSFTHGGRARIEVSEKEVKIIIAGQIGHMEFDIPVKFRKGSGQHRDVKMEGDIFPLPITRLTEWETNEERKTANIKQYEGLAFTRLKFAATLRSFGRALQLSINSEEIICELRN